MGCRRIRGIWVGLGQCVEESRIPLGHQNGQPHGGDGAMFLAVDPGEMFSGPYAASDQGADARFRRDGASLEPPSGVPCDFID